MAIIKVEIEINTGEGDLPLVDNRESRITVKSDGPFNISEFVFLCCFNIIKEATILHNNEMCGCIAQACFMALNEVADTIVDIPVTLDNNSDNIDDLHNGNMEFMKNLGIVVGKKKKNKKNNDG